MRIRTRTRVHTSISHKERYIGTGTQIYTQAHRSTLVPKKVKHTFRNPLHIYTNKCPADKLWLLSARTRLCWTIVFAAHKYTYKHTNTSLDHCFCCTQTGIQTRKHTLLGHCFCHTQTHIQKRTRTLLDHTFFYTQTHIQTHTRIMHTNLNCLLCALICARPLFLLVVDQRKQVPSFYVPVFRRQH
jgi:hypothetical protein